MDMEKNETEQQKSLKADEENCWLRICLWMIKLGLQSNPWKCSKREQQQQQPRL